MTLIRLNTRHPAARRNACALYVLSPFEKLRMGNGAQWRDAFPTCTQQERKNRFLLWPGILFLALDSYLTSTLPLLAPPPFVLHINKMDYNSRPYRSTQTVLTYRNLFKRVPYFRPRTCASSWKIACHVSAARNITECLRHGNRSRRMAE